MALLTLEEAKQQLDIDSGAHDGELQMYIDALDPVIEGYIGVVTPRTVTEEIEGWGPTLAVLHPPVLTVTSLVGLVAGGAGYTADTLQVNGPAGIIRRADGGVFSGGPFTVTYTAGRAEVPATVKLAAAILLQHLWRTQYGAARGLSAVGGGDDFAVTEPIPGFGYAVPNRVLQLLESFKQPPGVA